MISNIKGQAKPKCQGFPKREATASTSGMTKDHGNDQGQCGKLVNFLCPWKITSYCLRHHDPLHNSWCTLKKGEGWSWSCLRRLRKRGCFKGLLPKATWATWQAMVHVRTQGGGFHKGYLDSRRDVTFWEPTAPYFISITTSHWVLHGSCSRREG